MSKNQRQISEYKSVFFIDTQEKAKKVKIFLPEKYKVKGSPEIIQNKEFKNELGEFSFDVYRVKISANSLEINEKDGKEKYQVTILGEKKGETYQYTIEFNRFF